MPALESARPRRQGGAVPSGRFAPTPSGDLHLGNLRTALLAWLFARSTDRRFTLRVEDIDPQRSRPDRIAGQLADLRALGLDWDGVVVRQSQRIDRYRAAIAALDERGLVYECFCTRRDIQQAASAPHAAPGAYPGTCRDLSPRQRQVRRRSRPHPALRLRVEDGSRTVRVRDALCGEYVGHVDDFVLQRGDGVPAYNLAVVVDDLAAGVDQVVRGDDLLSSAPRQAYLTELLGGSVPQYAHVPLVLGPSGARLAKRDGAVTLSLLAAAGWPPARVRREITASLGLPDRTPVQLLPVFDPAALPRTPWTPSLPSL